MDKYQRCTRCVMDNTADTTITFDEDGYCNYCTAAIELGKRIYFPNEKGQEMINELVNRLKTENKDKEYDCLMGISGGLDSSYLAYLGYKWGLRILAVHIDDGYDTEISKRNIKKLIEKTKIDMITVQPDAEQFNDLTRAFILSGVPNIAIPQDNILFAELYKLARERKIKYFLSGGNYALECILQQGHTFPAYDLVNTKDIHRKFGRKPINKLVFISELQRIIDNKLYGIQSLRPLNYIDYNRERALKELNEFCGFEYYGSKHLENDLTAFIQLYYFVKKFKADKRTSHLSSMIVSGQMTRDEALEILSKPLYDEDEMEERVTRILKAIDLDRKTFDEVMAQPPRQHTCYKTSKAAPALNWVLRTLKKLGLR